MNLHRRLEQWRAAGLLDEARVAAILEYERTRARPTLAYAIGGLGAVAVAIGLVAIVAANWDAIPGSVKLGIDFVLGLVLAVVAVRAQRAKEATFADAVSLVNYGFVLASVGLIAQVYQQGGEIGDALLTWSVLTFAFMALGRGTWHASVWIVGLQVTAATWLERIEDFTDLEGLALGLAALMPLVLLVAGTLEGPARARGRACTGFAWLQLAMAGSVGTLAFYEDAFDLEATGFLVTFAVAIAMTAWLWGALRRRMATPEHLLAARVVLLGAVFMMFVPPLVSPGDLEFVAALAFIALWVGIAWAAHSIRAYRILNAATSIIAIRLLIVYFEVFGSLLDTGIALVSGGIVTLGLTWAWVRSRQRFAAQAKEERP